MKKVFLWRIASLTIFAIVLSLVFAAVGYTIFSRQTFTQMKLRDMHPKASAISEFVIQYSEGDIPRSLLATLIDKLSFENGESVMIFNSAGEVFVSVTQRDANIDTGETLEHIKQSVNNVYSTQTELAQSVSINGSTWLVLGRPITTDDGAMIGTLFLFDPLREMNASITALNTSLLLALAIVLPLLMMISILMVRHMTKPLYRITDAASAMANGDLDARANIQENGEIGMLAEAFNNLTAKLSATIRQLHAEKQQLDYLVTSISEGIIAFDSGGSVITVNPALCKLFGINKFESPLSLIPNQEFWDNFKQVYETGEGKILNYTIDEDKVALVAVVPIKAGEGAGDRFGVVGLFQDISEMERLERVRRDYVANVSHELRTPLTAIQGLLEPLSDGLVKDEPTVKRYYSIMYHEVKRLSRLISDMMEISRLQSRNDAIIKSEIDVCGIAADVRESFIVQACEKRITLGLDCDAKEMIAYGDPDRIEQMMVIFIDNAMRYTPPGGSIIIGVKDGERLTVSVADSGTGIPKKDLPHIFERFYKVDKSRREGGTGLGLSIASQIAEMLGEKLWVESEQEHGTTFFFTLRKPANTVSKPPETIGQTPDETQREAKSGGVIDADFKIIK